MKRKILTIVGLLLVAGGLLMPLAARAASNIRSGSTSSISSNEIIDASVYLAGKAVKVAGTVKGDVYCAGQTVEITGTITGDVFCASGAVIVTGQIGGSAHLAGAIVEVASPIAHHLGAFGQKITLDKTATIGTDATLYGGNLQLDGTIGRDVLAAAKDLSILGTIGRNATLQATSVMLTNTAHINGNLGYTSANQAQTSPGTMVMGKTEHHLPPAPKKAPRVDTRILTLWVTIYWIISTIILGLAVLGFAPRSFETAEQALIHQKGKSLLVGLSSLFVVPFLGMLLIATIVGAPLGIALLLLFTVEIIASTVFSSYALGAWVLEMMKWSLDSKWQKVGALSLGILILAILMLIPVIGFAAGFLALIWGLGGIKIMIHEQFKNYKKDSDKSESVESEK